MQGDARLAELTLERLVQTHKMNPEGQGLINLQWCWSAIRSCTNYRIGTWR